MSIAVSSSTPAPTMAASGSSCDSSTETSVRYVPLNSLAPSRWASSSVRSSRAKPIIWCCHVPVRGVAAATRRQSSVAISSTSACLWVKYQ